MEITHPYHPEIPPSPDDETGEPIPDMSTEKPRASQEE